VGYLGYLGWKACLRQKNGVIMTPEYPRYPRNPRNPSLDKNGCHKNVFLIGSDRRKWYLK
jgi:hypothetical protein